MEAIQNHSSIIMPTIKICNTKNKREKKNNSLVHFGFTIESFSSVCLLSAKSPSRFKKFGTKMEHFLYVNFMDNWLMSQS